MEPTRPTRICAGVSASICTSSRFLIVRHGLGRRAELRRKKSLIEKNDHCPDSVYSSASSCCVYLGNCYISRTHLSASIELNVAGRLHIMVWIRWVLIGTPVLLQRHSVPRHLGLKGLTGVWHGNQKLAAIGILVNQGITYDGLALNTEIADLPDPNDGQLLDIACRSLINEFSEVLQVRINYETMSRLPSLFLPFNNSPVRFSY
ncbi:hypothetical protein DVH24_009633 [Malus domestica]|uniref:Uncharacterized protein n=1 Tax=Malus domestica TaxID=3750 RepID=A0A498JUC9_MALDO|nr:hypothetical protein DVH24_009633 [Malus domestica]